VIGPNPRFGRRSDTRPRELTADRVQPRDQRTALARPHRHRAMVQDAQPSVASCSVGLRIPRGRTTAFRCRVRRQSGEPPTRITPSNFFGSKIVLLLYSDFPLRKMVGAPASLRMSRAWSVTWFSCRCLYRPVTYFSKDGVAKPTSFAQLMSSSFEKPFAPSAGWSL
jgi:hypothetical protein